MAILRNLAISCLRPSSRPPGAPCPPALTTADFEEVPAVLRVRLTQGGAQLARKHGGSLTALYWTLGAYDIVGVFEMSDDASYPAVASEVGSLGTLRTTTLRAFGEDEFKRIVARTG